MPVLAASFSFLRARHRPLTGLGSPGEPSPVEPGVCRANAAASFNRYVSPKCATTSRIAWYEPPCQAPMKIGLRRVPPTWRTDECE